MERYLIPALIIAPFAFLVMSHYWRATFFAALILAVFEGAIRKWLFPGAHMVIYFAKDVMLLTVYFGLFQEKQRIFLTPVARYIGTGFAFCVLFGVVQSINPESPSFLLYLIGFKSYFIYVPIVFVIPHLFKDSETLFKYVRLYIYIAAPIAILGFVQLYAGPTHWLNKYLSHSEEIAHVARFGIDGEYGRTSGTFSYVGGFTTYLTFICSLCVAYLALNDFKLNNAILVVITFTLCVGAMFTTGSRGPVVILSLTILLSSLYGVVRGLLSPVTLIRLVVLVPLLAYVGMQFAPEAVEGLSHRAQTTDSNLFRLIGPFYQPWMVFFQVPIFGFGMGSTHNSSLIIMKASTHWWLGGVRAESETARILMEIGHLGFVLFYGFLVASIVRSCSALFNFKSRRVALFGLVFMTFLSMMVLSPFVNNPMAGIYFWTSIGILHAFDYYLRNSLVQPNHLHPGNVRAGPQTQPVFKQDRRF